MLYSHSHNDKAPRADFFTFTSSVAPGLKFTFDFPASRPAGTRSVKRRRALSDVDGGSSSSEGRKKRRLRFIFCTSRLSRPFSQPATNIVNRGVGAKVAIGGKTKAWGRHLLRKAAILNRVRRRIDAAKEFMRRQQQQQQQGRETLALREIAAAPPRPRYLRDVPVLLAPSPLGLSNYDALDLEDELLHADDEIEGDDESAEDGAERRRSTIYSDFSFMNPSTGDGDGDGDDYDFLDALDGIPPPSTAPLPPEEETVVEILREREREKEGQSFFVHLGGS